MDNVLGNGTVLPSGLLGRQGPEAAIMAFNRSYRNTGIKAGIVVKSYAADDENNQNGLCTEYDVITFEQFENKGSTSILYRNCLSTQGFGGLADFLEYTLRAKSFQNNTGAPTFSDQDGAVVLIQCLDNVGDKAIVTGTLIHPDRTTNITSTAPQMSGEYNGVNVEIANDGSCSLTFKGDTDSKGVPTDSSQGNTVMQIETDGSFQFNHSTITIRADKNGTLSITTNVDCDITASGAVNVTSTKDTVVNSSAKCTITTSSDTVINSGGKCDITSSGDTIVKSGGDCDVTASGNVVVKGTAIQLNGQVSGITTFNGHLGVVDLITGFPVTPSPTVFGDV